MPVTYEFREKRSIITFENPPLNIFGQAMRAGLKDAIARARDDRPERLILRGRRARLRSRLGCQGI